MSDEQWHLDKRVPIALIVALLVQTTGAVWWASSINERVSQTERDVVVLDERTEAMRGVAQAQAVQLGRIEEQITGLRGDIRRLISAIERQDK